MEIPRAGFKFVLVYEWELAQGLIDGYHRSMIAGFQANSAKYIVVKS